MAQKVQYFSNNGKVKVSTENPKLDGGGSISVVVKAGNDGAFINSITIKAIGDTKQGMVRLFISDGTKYFLYKEVNVPANKQTAVYPAFFVNISDTLILQPGYALGVSTENSQPFNVIVEAVNWSNCKC